MALVLGKYKLSDSEIITEPPEWLNHSPSQPANRHLTMSMNGDDKWKSRTAYNLREIPLDGGSMKLDNHL